MRTRLLVAAAAVMMCGSAFAADIGASAPRQSTLRYAPAVVATPNYWDGFYVGAFGGGGKVGEANGGFGGLQLGRDWQSGQFVYGLRTDMALASIKHSEGECMLGVCVSESGKANWLGSTVAKVGYSPASAPNFLAYAVAGVAYGHVDYDLKVKGLISGSDSGSSTKVGPTVGAGLAYAFTPKWNLFAEYDYTHFGGDTQHYTVAGISGRVKHDSSNGHTVKGGINYRF